MNSYIAKHRRALSRRHYIRKATSSNYWFDFSGRKLNSYRGHYGDDFCLIIFGSEVVDDSYIIPYEDAKCVFTEEAMDDRVRWIGTIVDDVLRLAGGDSLSVRTYYNAFNLL